MMGTSVAEVMGMIAENHPEQPPAAPPAPSVAIAAPPAPPPEEKAEEAAPTPAPKAEATKEAPKTEEEAIPEDRLQKLTADYLLNQVIATYGHLGEDVVRAKWTALRGLVRGEGEETPKGKPPAPKLEASDEEGLDEAEMTPTEKKLHREIQTLKMDKERERNEQARTQFRARVDAQISSHPILADDWHKITARDQIIAEMASHPEMPMEKAAKVVADRAAKHDQAIIDKYVKGKKEDATKGTPSPASAGPAVAKTKKWEPGMPPQEEEEFFRATYGTNHGG